MEEDQELFKCLVKLVENKWMDYNLSRIKRINLAAVYWSRCNLAMKLNCFLQLCKRFRKKWSKNTIAAFVHLNQKVPETKKERIQIELLICTEVTAEEMGILAGSEMVAASSNISQIIPKKDELVSYSGKLVGEMISSIVCIPQSRTAESAYKVGSIIRGDRPMKRNYRFKPPTEDVDGLAVGQFYFANPSSFKPLSTHNESYVYEEKATEDSGKGDSLLCTAKTSSAHSLEGAGDQIVSDGEPSDKESGGDFISQIDLSKELTHQFAQASKQLSKESGRVKQRNSLNLAKGPTSRERTDFSSLPGKKSSKTSLHIAQFVGSSAAFPLKTFRNVEAESFPLKKDIREDRSDQVQVPSSHNSTESTSCSSKYVSDQTPFYASIDQLKIPIASDPKEKKKDDFTPLEETNVEATKSLVVATLSDAFPFKVKESYALQMGKVLERLSAKAVTAKKTSPLAVVVSPSVPDPSPPVKKQNNSRPEIVCADKQPGCILYTNSPLFAEGSVLPVPSQAAIDSNIGQGGNGTITIIYFQGEEFAVKKTHYRFMEVDVMARLDHKNILPLLSVMMGEEDPKRSRRFFCYHFLPKMSGDLQSYLNKIGHGGISTLLLKYKDEPEVLQLIVDNTKHIVRSVLRGLDHLHQNNIVHNDVKPSNFLLDMHCTCEGPFMCIHGQRFEVKVGDFDSAIDLPRLQTNVSLVGQLQRSSPIGTPGYRPVEYILIATRTRSDLTDYDTLTAPDIWSVGASMLKIFLSHSGPYTQKHMAFITLCNHKYFPWNKESAAVGKIKKIKLLKSVYPNWTQLWQFVEDCLQVVPKDRPICRKLLKHEFFSS